MNPDGWPREDRTALFGVVADCEHKVEGLTGELLNVFRRMRRDIDSNLPHSCYCFRSNETGSTACAFDFESIAGIMTKQTFRHLAACGICGAKNQDAPPQATTPVHKFMNSNPGHSTRQVS